MNCSLGKLFYYSSCSDYEFNYTKENLEKLYNEFHNEVFYIALEFIRDKKASGPFIGMKILADLKDVRGLDLIYQYINHYNCSYRIMAHYALYKLGVLSSIENIKHEIRNNDIISANIFPAIKVIIQDKDELFNSEISSLIKEEGVSTNNKLLLASLLIDTNYQLSIEYILNNINMASIDIIIDVINILSDHDYINTNDDLLKIRDVLNKNNFCESILDRAKKFINKKATSILYQQDQATINDGIKQSDLIFKSVDEVITSISENKDDFEVDNQCNKHIPSVTFISGYIIKILDKLLDDQEKNPIRIASYLFSFILKYMDNEIVIKIIKFLQKNDRGLLQDIFMELDKEIRDELCNNIQININNLFLNVLSWIREKNFIDIFNYLDGILENKELSVVCKIDFVETIIYLNNNKAIDFINNYIFRYPHHKISEIMLFYTYQYKKSEFVKMAEKIIDVIKNREDLKYSRIWTTLLNMNFMLNTPESISLVYNQISEKDFFCYKDCLINIKYVDMGILANAMKIFTATYNDVKKIDIVLTRIENSVNDKEWFKSYILSCANSVEKKLIYLFLTKIEQLTQGQHYYL